MSNNPQTISTSMVSNPKLVTMQKYHHQLQQIVVRHTSANSRIAAIKKLLKNENFSESLASKTLSSISLSVPNPKKDLEKIRNHLSILNTAYIESETSYFKYFAEIKRIASAY
jgi:hypothetical protein